MLFTYFLKKYGIEYSSSYFIALKYENMIIFVLCFFFSKDPQLEDQDLSDVDSHGDNIFKVKYLF